MKFLNFLLLIFDSVFRFHFCFRDSVSGFRIPCFSAAASCGSAYGMGGGRGGGACAAEEGVVFYVFIIFVI